MRNKFATISGKKVEVTPYTVFETDYGLKFSLKEFDKIVIDDEYDRTVARTHVANCGFVICYRSEVIDNEYDLDIIYQMIEDGKCVTRNR